MRLGVARRWSGRLLGDKGRRQWRSLSRYLQISAVISSSIQHAPKPSAGGFNGYATAADPHPSIGDGCTGVWLCMYACVLLACSFACLFACQLAWLFACLVGVCAFGGFLGPPGSLLGASWGLLGASWGPLGASWRPLGAESSDFRFVVLSWAPLGAVLGPSWAVLVPSWEPLGPSRADLGGLLGRLGASGSRKGENPQITK